MLPRSCVIVTMLFVLAPALGGAPPPGVRDEGDIVFVEDVVYHRTTDDAGRPVALALDAAFRKRGGDAPLPAIVYVHGGRWAVGSRADGTAVTAQLARGGYFAVTIDYRLAASAKYPAAVDDVKAAVRFLRAHAKELGVDPARIGVWGHAAGGHLSALVATTAPPADPARVACAVSVAGPADLAQEGFTPEAQAIIDFWIGGPTPAAALARAHEASPLTHVDAGDPPILLVHGTADPLLPIDQSRRFHRALREAGVESDLYAVEGAGHHVDDPGANRQIAAFLDRHLGGAVRRTLDEAREVGRTPTTAPDR